MLTDEIFVALIDLYMDSDGAQLGSPSDQLIDEFLDAEAQERGFASWSDAYGKIPEKGKGD